MKKPIQISIPSPCHENWDDMTPSDKGRFCASCQKNVIDFTNSSDRQIADAYEKDKKLCGLFLDSQLNRDLVVPKEKKGLWIAASAALISLFAGAPQAHAQQKAPTEQGANKILGDTVASPAKRFISGIVTDKDGVPLKNVLVINKTTEVYTDEKGYFKIEAKKGDSIEFSVYNKKDLKLTVTDESQYKVTLKPLKKSKATRTMGRLF